MKYRILSPDGLPLCDADPKVNTQAKVIAYIMEWTRQRELAGGGWSHYLTAKGERIHWLDLPYRMPIIRWGNRGKITEMRVARVGYEQWPNKLEQERKHYGYDI